MAALFGRLRRRAQAIVDRRFDRSRYDAALTVQGMTVRLRDDVDLDRVEADVLGVVDRTFHPSSAGHVAPVMRRVATTTLGLILLVATMVVGMGLTSMAGDAGEDLGFFGFLFAGLWLYWALGTLIVARADGHIVGWLFAVAAAVMALVFTGYAMGALLEIDQSGHPMSAWFGLVGALLFPIALILILPAVALTFPTGTLPGPRWRWPVGLVGAMVIVGTVAILIRPGPMGGDGPDNPLTPWLPAVTHGWARGPGRPRRHRQPVSRVRSRSGDRRDRGPVSAITRRRTTAAEVVPGGHGTCRGPAPVESQ